MAGASGEWEHPVLAEFRDKYNAYRDVPDDVLARRIVATYPGVYDESLAAVSKPPQPPAPQPTMIQRGLQGVTTGASNVIQGLDVAQRGGMPFAGLTPPEAQGVAKFVVPQDEVELGTDLALGTAGKLVKGASRAKQVITRLAAGAGGGEVGGQVAGLNPGEGAARGAIATGTGEILGPLASKTARSVPGAKKAILENDAARLGEWIDGVVPALKGARTSQDLAKLAREGVGKQKLDAYFGAKLKEADTAIGSQPINVPALGGSMSLREAQDKLAELGHAGFGGTKADPAKRTVVGRDDRQLWAEAVVQIESELGRLDKSGDAVRAFRDARTQFSRGLTILRSLERGDTFVARPNRTDLNTPGLQDRVSGAQSLYRQRFTPQQIEDLNQALYRGGGFHTKDDLAPTGGGFWDPLRDVWGKGIGGASQIPGALFRTPVPNIGSRYTGTAPRSMTPDQQTLLDILINTVMSKGMQP